MPTLFERIAAGEIPAHIVHEDDACFAFLDINPVSRGHTLLVPREPAETLDQLSDDAAAALGRALPRLTRAVMTATGCAGLNVLQNNGEAAGQVVPHVHIHLIPKYPDGTGLRKTWTPGDLHDATPLRDAIAAAVNAT